MHSFSSHFSLQLYYLDIECTSVNQKRSWSLIKFEDDFSILIFICKLHVVFYPCNLNFNHFLLLHKSHEVESFISWGKVNVKFISFSITHFDVCTVWLLFQKYLHLYISFTVFLQVCVSVFMFQLYASICVSFLNVPMCVWEYALAYVQWVNGFSRYHDID